MADDSQMTYEEAQEAVDEGDTVTTSELQEMYPDKNMNQICYDMSKENAELEMKSKIEEIYQFNEPRQAAIQGRKTYHTGPKGVLTDFEEAKLKMRANRIDDKIKRQNKKYMTLDNDHNETAYALKIIDAQKQKPSAKQLRREHKCDAKDNDGDDIDSDDLLDDEHDDDDDEEALQLYKIQRMKIMQEHQPRFGDTKEVTAFTFKEEVENAPKNIWVVMHVYQDYMERCARMNYAIGQIAKSYPHIKFLRARSDRIALEKYPEIGMPTLIVFKNGEQLQNHIAVHEIIGNPFDVKDVEEFLISNGIIKPIVLIPEIDEIKKKLDNEKNSKHSNAKKLTNINIKTNANVKYANNECDDESDSELDID